jgi:hypothetical protein
MKVLDRLPYAATTTTENVRGETVHIKPYQIVVWVSIGLRQFMRWDRRAPRLPAILDTGNNHNLSIGHAQLVRWAGIQLASLRRLGTIRERGTRVPLHAARLWLHPNLPGAREVRSIEPIPLKIEEGIAIYPDESAPRLPVFGLRALTLNKLHLRLDPDRQMVHLRTPDWRTKLMQMLF